MRSVKLLIFFAYFVGHNYADESFITYVAPKEFYPKTKYTVSFLSSERSNTDLGIQFSKMKVTFNLRKTKFNGFEFNSKAKNGKNVNLFFTLLQNNTKTGRIRCSTKEIKVALIKKRHHIFIQTDKPIYKPEDTVKFRILVVDKHLNPWHMNNIQINVTDPTGRIIDTFESFETSNIGVVEQEFRLEDDVELGDWNISVIVDKESQRISKVFSVQKYTLPLYDLELHVSEKNVLSDAHIGIFAAAKYPFGEGVTGYAQLTIKSETTEYFKMEYKDKIDIKLSVRTDLKIDIVDAIGLRLNAIVVFTEPESGLKINKTEVFTVYSSKKFRIKVYHSKNYMPGHYYSISVDLFDWKFERDLKSYESVKICYKITLANGDVLDPVFYRKADAYMISFDYLVPTNAVKFEFEVSYISSEIYRYAPTEGSTIIGINAINVESTPKNPKLGKQVTITTSKKEPIDVLIMNVVTRFGILESRRIDCNDNPHCEFNVHVNAEMLPHSRIVVYHVKSNGIIHQGQTNITSNEIFGNNTLTMQLSKSIAKPKEKIKISFTSNKNSKIYLLAYDKRLKYLREGNEITQYDVVKESADFDGQNFIQSDDMTSWNECTKEELDRVIEGRVNSLSHITGTRFGAENEDELDEFDELNDLDEKPDWEDDSGFLGDQTREVEPVESDDREDFPESWIFDTLEQEEVSISKQYRVPDSMTTWMISAFAIHKEVGLAMIKTQELIAKNELFMVMNLPYSIRYKEILRVDIMVYNYVESKEKLDVTVELHNKGKTEFEFVSIDQKNNNKKSFSTEEYKSQTVSVPSSSVKRVSFYIRSFLVYTNNTEIEYLQRSITLKVKGHAIKNDGKKVFDILVQNLQIEPFGIKNYEYRTYSGNSKGDAAINYKLPIPKTQDNLKLTKIEGFMKSVVMKTSAMHRSKFYYQSGCLEQTTSMIRSFVEIYRVLRHFGENHDLADVKKLYQGMPEKVRTTQNRAVTCSYLSYQFDTYKSAQRAGALPIHEDEISAIIQRLMKCNDDPFVYFHPINGDVKTKNYFKNAYMLIPFLKHGYEGHANYKNFVDEMYRYLDNPNNVVGVNPQGLAVAAYVYAMHKDKKSSAVKLLKVLEDHTDLIIKTDDRKCYKIKTTDGTCDNRHTAYMALAYMALNNLTEAAPIVNSLINVFDTAGMNALTHEFAGISPAISEMMILTKTKGQQNLYVKINNDRGNEVSASFTETSSKEDILFEFPKFSEQIDIEVIGTGYYSISVGFEYLQLVPLRTSILNLELTADPKTYTLKICLSIMKEDIQNLVYEVDMPSGFVYSKLEKQTTVNDYLLDQSKLGGTFVVFYKDNMKVNDNYCFKIKATKVATIENTRDAGVKVYDYDRKDQATYEFYNFQ